MLNLRSRILLVYRAASRPLGALATVWLALSGLCLLVPGCGGDSESQELLLTLTPSATGPTGYISVAGTVQTSRSVPKGARAVFGINAGRPLAAGVFDESVEARAPAETDTISVRIKNLRAGEAYSFYVGVDLNEDGNIGPGDMGGYYDGSTVLPFSDPGSARLIPVRQNIKDLNFGIGDIR